MVMSIGMLMMNLLPMLLVKPTAQMSLVGINQCQ